jgi:hypothetical protein
MLQSVNKNVTEQRTDEDEETPGDWRDILYLNAVHPDVLCDTRNKNYSVQHIIFIVKIHLYTNVF